MPHPAVIIKRIYKLQHADDFIITGESREVLEEIKQDLILFLKERGLELSEEKTLITHVNDGFDFLGFNIRKYRNGMLLIKPSKNSQKKFAEATQEVIYSLRSRKQADVIDKLNPKIAGWANYYRYVTSKQVFSRIDHILVLQLWRWAIRRHCNKSLKWVRDKYWMRKGGRTWTFQTSRKDRKGNNIPIILTSLADTPLMRYTKIKAEANPFDPQYDEYFKNRRELSRQMRPLKRSA